MVPAALEGRPSGGPRCCAGPRVAQTPSPQLEYVLNEKLTIMNATCIKKKTLIKLLFHVVDAVLSSRETKDAFCGYTMQNDEIHAGSNELWNQEI